MQKYLSKNFLQRYEVSGFSYQDKMGGNCQIWVNIPVLAEIVSKSFRKFYPFFKYNSWLGSKAWHSSSKRTCCADKYIQNTDCQKLCCALYFHHCISHNFSCWTCHLRSNVTHCASCEHFMFCNKLVSQQEEITNLTVNRISVYNGEKITMVTRSWWKWCQLVVNMGIYPN